MGAWGVPIESGVETAETAGAARESQCDRHHRHLRALRLRQVRCRWRAVLYQAREAGSPRAPMI